MTAYIPLDIFRCYEMGWLILFPFRVTWRLGKTNPGCSAATRSGKADCSVSTLHRVDLAVYTCLRGTPSCESAQAPLCSSTDAGHNATWASRTGKTRFLCGSISTTYGCPGAYRTAGWVRSECSQNGTSA